MSVDRKVEQIVKLLALAQSTSNVEEAAAYTEKAQHLASINSIDLALARERQKQKEKREEPTVKVMKIGIDGKPHKNRFLRELFGHIADVNDVKWSVSRDNAKVWAHGFPSDIEVTEILFTSLAVQLEQSTAHSLQLGEHRIHGIHGATWRTNYAEGFVSRLGSRLRMARSQALAEQKERDEAAARLLEPVLEASAVPVPEEEQLSTALVMKKKAEEVDEYYRNQNPGIRTAPSYSYGAGRKARQAQTAGRTGADRARLGGGAGELSGGGTKQLG